MNSPYSRPVEHSLTDVAVMLSVTEQNIYELIRTGHVKARNVGRDILIPDSEVSRIRNTFELQKKRKRASSRSYQTPPSRITARDRALRAMGMSESSDEGVSGGLG